jgi:hypothetical protein
LLNKYPFDAGIKGFTARLNLSGNMLTECRNVHGVFNVHVKGETCSSGPLLLLGAVCCPNI